MGVDGQAYWYKKGKLIAIQGQYHIEDICKNPEVFGLTKNIIKSIYKKNKETVGVEGNSREEIMIKAMDNGWIRIRQSIGTQGTIWTFQFDNFAKRKKDLQELTSKLLLDKKEMKDTDVLYLLSYSGDYEEEYSAFDGKKPSSFLTEKQKKRGSLIKEVRSYFDY